MKTYKLKFSTEYYQFYILDSQSEGKTDAPDFWCDIAGKRRLAIGEGILGVTIATYGNVFGEVHILDKKPQENKKANHIVEASINFISGKLQIKDCTNYEIQLEIDLDKTDYRVRISTFGLETVMNDEGNDNYLIEIWKYKFSEPKLINKYIQNFKF
jgi:hypothetical protein